MSWPVGIPKTLSPAQRSERARLAALSRTSPDYFIRQLGKATLTPEQRHELALILVGPDPAVGDRAPVQAAGR